MATATVDATKLFVKNIPIILRALHCTPALYAPKKRRKSASSARKKAQKQQSNKNKNQQKQKKKKHQHQKQTTRSNQSKNQNPPTRRPKQHKPTTAIPDPIERQRKNEREDVPRAFLTSTASKYAYIAKCAVIDEETGQVYIDPKSLFSELSQHNNKDSKNNHIHNQQQKQKQYRKKNGTQRVLIPRIFRNSHFHYFPPSSFPNYEPPRDGKAPEVAFLGRSNTGKSSLINALQSLILGGSDGR
mmetsp:Transcript_31352/g.66361  ORF Transcript_31352/g.66361 Transcript_31352/m.66361 type:complete len:244 (+) Transcript_31352:233-964(+)